MRLTAHIAAYMNTVVKTEEELQSTFVHIKFKLTDVTVNNFILQNKKVTVWQSAFILC